MRLGTSAALVVACLSLATHFTLADAAPPTSLATLERSYAAYLLRARPDLAWRAGAKAAASRLEPVTTTNLAQQTAWLARFERELQAVPRETLTPAESTRLDTLLARTSRQHSECGLDGPFRRDPLAYRALTDFAVLEVITAPRVGECERVRRATRRLLLVPEVLRAAALNLRDTPYDSVRVQQGLDDAIRVLRADVTAAAAACRDPQRTADFVEADSAAIRAFELFPRWLNTSAGAAR